MTSNAYLVIAFVLLIPGALTVLGGIGFAVFMMLKDKEYGLVSFFLFLLITTILSSVFHELYQHKKADEEKAVEVRENFVKEHFPATEEVLK